MISCSLKTKVCTKNYIFVLQSRTNSPELIGCNFYALRHHFASKLVMGGVDLNTVRELLGHANLDLAIRYALLAPEHTAVAVALIR
jgi:site-specific recombinase XerD